MVNLAHSISDGMVWPCLGGRHMINIAASQLVLFGYIAQQGGVVFS